MSIPTILCVDDERNVLLTLRAQLMRHFPGYAIEIAESGDEALALVNELKAEGKPVVLVIADQIMPGMQGDQLLIELHAHHPEILNVMLTGQARAEDVGNVVNQGNLYRFIAKPWNEIDLSLTVNEALRRYQQEQQLKQQQAALEQANRELAALNANLEQQVQERTQQLQQSEQQLQLTDRVRTEIALQESEERYRCLSEVNPVGIFRRDTQGHCIYANPRTVEITGLTLEENLGEGWGQYLHPDDRDQIYATWSHFVKQIKLGHAAEYQVEHRYRYPDGSLKWVLIQAAPEHNAAGELVGFVGSVVDITDRKQAEVSLQRSEAKQAALIDALPDLVMRISGDGVYLDFFTTPVFKVIGNRDLLVGTRVEASLPPELAQLRMNAIQAALQTGEVQVYEQEIVIEGEVQTEECRVVVCGDNEVLVIGRDITERKQAETKIRESEELLRLTLEFTGIGAWSWQPSTGEYHWDGKMLELLELPPGLDNMFQIWRDRIHPDDVDRVEANLQQALATRTAIAEEYRYQLSDGRTVWRWFRGQGIYTETGELEQVLGVVQDIDDRKQAETQLETQNALLARIAKGEPLSNILNALIDQIEQKLQGASCCILLADQENRLQHEFALSLPETYVQALSDILIAEGEGSCGTAAFRKQTVIVSDIAHDRLWDQSRDLALAHELRACWSIPMLAGGGQVLGTFAAYYQGVRSPQVHELETISQMANIAGIAIERQRSEQVLRQSELRLKESQEIAKLGGWEINLRSGEEYWSDEMFNIHELGMTDECPRCLEDADYYINFYAPEARPIIREAFQNAIQTGAHYDLELPFMTAQGNHRWVKALGQPVLTDGIVTRLKGILLDITDRKQAEAQLRESEDRFRQLAESVREGFFVFETATQQYTYVNPACEAITGLSFTTGNGFAQWLDRVHPEDHDRVEAALEQELQHQVFDEEYRFIGTNGAVRWLRSQAFPITDETGTLTRIVGTVEDITDRKNTEVALQEKQQQLTSLLNNIPHIAWLKDRDNRFLAVNEPFAQACGYRASQLVGLTDLDIWPTHLAEAYRQDDREVMDSRQQKRVEEPLLTAAGEEQWIETIKTPILNERGESVGTAGIAMDITQRKRTERTLQRLNEELEQRVQQRTQELARSEQDLRTIFNNVYDAILIHDMDGTILDANDRALELRGATREQLLAANIPDLAAPDAPIEQLPEILRRVQAGETLRFEWREQRVDNHSIFDVEVSLRPVTLGNRPVFIAGVRDISDRKQAERNLRESQEFIQTVLNTVPMPMFWKDRNSIFLGCNQQLAQVMGLESTAHIIGKTGFEFSPSDSEVASYYADDQQIMASGIARLGIEETFTLPTGEQRWIETHKAPLRDWAGNVVGIVGMFQDITDRKRAEKALQDSERRYATLATAAPVAIFRFDPALNCTYVNDHWSGMTGRPKEAAFGQGWLEALHPDDRDRLLAQASAQTPTTQPGLDYGEGRHLLPDGSIRWFYVQVAPDIEADGTLAGYIGTLTDITVRKQIEFELAESETKFRHLVERSNDVIWSFDKNGLFTYLSPQFKNLSGWEPHEWLGKPFTDLIHPDDRAMARADYQENIQLDRKSSKLEFRHHHRDGHYVWVQCSPTLIKNAAGLVVGAQGILSDISDLKQAELELRESRRFLQTVIDTFPLVVFWKDCNSVYLGCNFKSAEAAGLDSPADIIGKTDYDMPWGETEAENYRADDRAVLESGEARLGIIETQLRADGSRIWIETNKLPLYNLSGEVIGILGTYQDITDRKLAEEALKAERLRLQLALDAASMGTWSCNLLTGQLIWSDHAQEIFGFVPGTFSGDRETFLSLVHSEDRDRVIQAIAHTFETGAPYAIEYRIHRLDDAVRWIAVWGIIPEGLPPTEQQLIGVVSDITDRKQAEQALRESEFRLAEKNAILQSVIESTPDVVFVKDQEGRIMIANSSFVSFFEQPLEALLGKSDAELWPPEMARYLRELDLRIMRTGNAETLEESVPHADGMRTYLTTKSPWYDAEGSILGTIGLSRDISDRKQAEEALRDSEERFRATFEQAAVGMVQANLEGQFVQLNQKFCDIVGYSESELQLKSFEEITYPDDVAPDKANISRLLAGVASNFVMEKRYICANGAIVWVNLSVSLVRNVAGEPQYFIAAVQDISDRKQAEHDLQESRNMLELVLDTIPQRVFWKDRQSRFLGCNSAFANDYNLTPEDIIGNTDLELPWAEWADLYRTDDARVVSTRVPKLNYEEPTVNLNGEQIWIRSSKIPLTNSEGDVIGILGCYDDITDRKQAEQQLQAERLRLQLALEAANMGTWESNLETGLWSERTEAIFGYAPGTFPGDREAFLKLVHNDDQERVFGALANSFATRSPYNVEYRINRLDGELRWVAVSGKAVANDDGSELRIVGVALDITDRKRAEEALRDSEERLRLALTATNQGLYDLNVQSGEAIVSPEYVTMLGYDPATFQETNARWIERLHPDDLEPVAAVYRAYTAGEIPDYKVEFRQRTQDGTWKWILSVGKIVTWDEAGQPLRMLGTHTDIDERKRVEEELRQAVTTNQAILNAIPDLILRIRRDGIYRDAIPSQEVALLLARDEFIGRSVWEILPADLAQQRLAAIEQAFQTGLPQIHEYQIHIDGDLRYEEARCVVCRDDEAMVLVRDITDRKQAEAALQQLNLELEQRVSDRTLELQQTMEAAEAANRAKSIFLANMSHELRTPLNAILGFAQLLSRDLTMESEKRQQLTIINRSGEHLLSLINDILEMSKIEAGRTIFVPSCFNLYSLLDNLEEMFQLRASEKGLYFRVDRVSTLPNGVETDENKLRQVLINLVGNAIKFTASGHVNLRVFGKMGDQGDLKLHFEVIDTGIGIAPDELESLFEPFMQSRNRQVFQEGTGLGLSISRQFVQLMGGTLTVTSTLGAGSTFAFAIPVQLTDVTNLSPSSLTGHILGLAPNQPSYRILVVEDTETNRLLIVQLLQSLGFEVREATQGEQAIALWKTWQPHLIWMDMRMPVMDGYEATRQIRLQESLVIGHQPFVDSDSMTQDNRQNTIIIALTASAFEEDRARVLAAGCNDFVRKPFQEIELLEKMAEHLGVKYVYAEATQAESESIASSSSFDAIAALQSLPNSLLTQLHQATLQLDNQQLAVLLQQVATDQPTLAALLLDKLDNFDLDQILHLLQAALE